MTIPNFELFYGLLTVIPGSLLLDSATDGILDTNTLGGFEETQYAFDVPIVSLNISRGRSKQLDRFTAGSATINFNNFDRKLDPLNADSPFDGLIVPRLRMQIYANGQSIFKGTVTDWNIEYDIINLDTASVSLSDAFTIFANFNFEDDITPPQQESGDRLKFVVDEFNYRGEYAFGGGPMLMGAYQINRDTNALDYMINVAKSVRGFLFTDAKGRLNLVSPTDRQPSTSVFFSDDGTGSQYRSLNVEYNDELLYNRVIATSPAGSVVVQNDDSIASFETSTLVLSELLNRFLFDLQFTAERFLELYSEPLVRFRGLSVELAGLSEAETSLMLRLDITDQVTVRKTFEVGSPLVVEQDLVITGVKHNVSAQSHIIEFTFEPSPFKFGFILDDPIFGILDSETVLF
jgi:hypothetical protein